MGINYTYHGDTENILDGNPLGSIAWALTVKAVNHGESIQWILGDQVLGLKKRQNNSETTRFPQFLTYVNPSNDYIW